MAKLVQRPTVQVEAIFTVNEAELRALDALVGYGDDAFIKAFKQNLGESYMRPHEAGLREFFKTIRQMAPGILSRTDDARYVFDGIKTAVGPSDARAKPPQPSLADPRQTHAPSPERAAEQLTTFVDREKEQIAGSGPMHDKISAPDAFDPTKRYAAIGEPGAKTEEVMRADPMHDKTTAVVKKV